MATNDIIVKIVNGVKSQITNNATALGGITKVGEKDEHPSVPAERNELPVAYVLPIVEGGDDIDMTMGGSEIHHTFPITTIAYYPATTTTEYADDIDTNLVNTRRYAYNFLDLWATQNYSDRGQIYKGHLDLGYWIGGDGQVVYYWVWKLNLKAYI